MEVQIPINLAKGGLNGFLKGRRVEIHSFNKKLNELENDLEQASRIHNGTVLYNINPEETIVFLKKKLRLLKNQPVSKNPKSDLFLRNIQIIHTEKYDRTRNFYLTRIGLIFTFNRHVKCNQIDNIDTVDFYSGDGDLKIVENSGTKHPFQLTFKDKNKYTEVRDAIQNAYKNIKKK